MLKIFKGIMVAATLLAISSPAVVTHSALGQETGTSAVSRDSLLSAAREIMTQAHFCALVTIDSVGGPQTRAMDPFPPEAGMIVWLGTNAHSRKVRHIRKNPEVALFYLAPDASGYVSLTGTAKLIDAPEQKAKHWKKEWTAFYPDREKDYLLIRVRPSKLEVLSGKHGISGDAKTWATPTVTFDAAE